MHHDDVRRHADARDRREILRLVRQLRHERWRDRIRRDVAVEQRVAVRGRFCDERRADRPGRADSVVDVHLLLPHLRQLIGEQTADHVVGRACREGDDVTYGLDGEGLAPRRDGPDQHGRRKRVQKCCSTCSDHSTHHAPPPERSRFRCRHWTALARADAIPPGRSEAGNSSAKIMRLSRGVFTRRMLTLEFYPGAMEEQA